MSLSEGGNYLSIQPYECTTAANKYPAFAVIRATQGSFLSKAIKMFAASYVDTMSYNGR